MDDRSRARKTIEKIRYITIATSDRKGRPWNTPIYSAYGNGYTFYWVTSPRSRHSLNIKQNKRVAIVVYDSTVPEGAGFGVYIDARSGMVTDRAEQEKALRLLYGRKNKNPRPLSDFTGSSPRRIYKAVPRRFWVNSVAFVRGHPVDIRKEIRLA